MHRSNLTVRATITLILTKSITGLLFLKGLKSTYDPILYPCMTSFDFLDVVFYTISCRVCVHRDVKGLSLLDSVCIHFFIFLSFNFHVFYSFLLLCIKFLDHNMHLSLRWCHTMSRFRNFSFFWNQSFSS